MSREQNNPGDQPASLGDASGFTQLFGKAPLEAGKAAQPFTPEVQYPRNAALSPDQGITAIFAPTKTDLEKETASSLASHPSEAPTQIFAAVSLSDKSAQSVSPTEETRIFSTVPAPRGGMVPNEVSSTVSPPLAHSVNEFTSVFQPIAPPPAMPAPPVAAAMEAAAGEFTQFFSAVSVRANAAAPARSAPASAPSVQAAAPTKTEAQAGEFTQLFQQQPLPTPTKAAVVAPPQPTMPAGAQDRAQPGSFTQMFLQPPAATPSQAPQVLPASSAQAASTLPPIFGEAAPRGSFTDIFAANPVPQPAPGRASAEGANFFAGEPSPLFTPPTAAKPAGVPSSFGALVPAEPAPMQTAAPGEFTRLVQSLERPASASPGSAQPLPVDAAFFASNHASGGESEYTRVLRGGAAGLPAGAGIPMAAPASGSAAAPGLALAPASVDGTHKQTPEKQKPRLLVILLVVLNVLLLVALLVIGLVLLRRR